MDGWFFKLIVAQLFIGSGRPAPCLIKHHVTYGHARRFTAKDLIMQNATMRLDLAYPRPHPPRRRVENILLLL
jgi:hypothetical protein